VFIVVACACQHSRYNVYDYITPHICTQMPELEIEAVHQLPELHSLEVASGNVQVLLAETAVLKLNGGLGTSMGLEKAKSLLEVRLCVEGTLAGKLYS